MSKSMARQALTKVRSKLLSDVVRRIDDIEEDIESKVRHVQFTLEQTSQVLKQEMQTLSHEPRLMYISPHEIVAKLFDGTKMYLDPRDMAVVPHLALDGIWEGWITRGWLSVVKSESIIFDVGANFGYFGVLAAQHINRKKSKVVFFEPNPHLLPYIKKSLGVNWLYENAVIENLAVADKPGNAELHLLKDYVGSSSLHSMEHVDAYMGGKMYLEESEAVKVKTVTIDDYCEEHDIDHIDLMKVDIEGFEEKAYAGMKRMVKQSPEMVMFLEFTKQSYEDPEGFYEEMKKDFGHLYLVEGSGALGAPKDTSYSAVVGPAEDWIMLVLSKKKLV